MSTNGKYKLFVGGPFDMTRYYVEDDPLEVIFEFKVTKEQHKYHRERFSIFKGLKNKSITWSYYVYNNRDQSLKDKIAKALTKIMGVPDTDK